MRSSLVALILLLVSTHALAVPASTQERLLVEALEKLLRVSPIPRDQAKSGESPFQARADELFRRAEIELELALPGAEIPLTDGEREELYRELRNYPAYLERLGYLLPRRPEVLEWAASQFDDSSYRPLWLLANHPRQRSGLIESALEDPKALEALVLLDWAAAEPLVEKRLRGKSLEDVLAGLAALRRYPPREEEARSSLMALFNDPKTGDSERAEAAALLLKSEWKGRDDFFLSVLEEPTWYKNHEDFIGDFAVSHPQWAPRLVILLDDPRPSVHNNAVAALLEIARANPSPDTVRPLLPWLLDENWADSEIYRDAFIEIAGGAKAPEAVPGLLHVLRTSPDESAMTAAAHALTAYQPKGFEGAWRAAKPRFKSQGYGESLAEIGVTQGWIPLKEQIQAVAAHFEQGDDVSWDAPDVFPLLLGSTCVYGDISPALRNELIKLCKRWQHEGNPGLEGLEEALARQRGPEWDAYFLSRLYDTDISPELLSEILHRRDSLVAAQVPTLKAMMAKKGAKAGVARAMLKLGPQDQPTLGEDDAQALSLISTSRFLGDALPSAWLEEAASKPGLREAVMAYLESSEDEGSTTLLKSLDPGFRITGRKPATYNFDELENALVRRFQELPEGSELYALATTHEGHSIIRASAEIWVREGKAELTFRSKEIRYFHYTNAHPSYERRELTKDELNRFLAFVKGRSVDTWPEWLNVTTDHFSTYQYLHVGQGGGRRVAIAEGFEQGARTKYAELVDLFSDLQRVPAQTVYEIMDDFPQARVIEDHLDCDLLLADSEGLKARVVGERGEKCWRLLGPEGLREAAASSPLLPERFTSDGHDATVLTSGVTLIDRYQRLVRDDGQKETTILKGDFMQYGLPVVESAGKRGLLRELEGKGETLIQTFKLIDLDDGALSDVSVPPGPVARPVAYLPDYKKFFAVVSEEVDDDLKQAKCFLIDPWSGEATRLPSGELRPFLTAARRPLQPADDTHYWVAVRSDLGTEVGLLDKKTFRFEPVTHYPGVFFDSSQMWVAGPYVYAAIGDILRLPLNP